MSRRRRLRTLPAWRPTDASSGISSTFDERRWFCLQTYCVAAGQTSLDLPLSEQLFPKTKENWEKSDGQGELQTSLLQKTYCSSLTARRGESRTTDFPFALRARSAVFLGMRHRGACRPQGGEACGRREETLQVTMRKSEPEMQRRKPVTSMTRHLASSLNCL